MTDYPNLSFGRLATPLDIPRLVSGDDVMWSFPPPGTTEVLWAFPEPWVVLVGEATTGGGDTWWMTTLGHATGLTDLQLLAQGARYAGLLTGPLGAFAASVGSLPVIYTMGQRAMRWINTVFRGTLGTTEQFQFHVNWGTPGDDPDLDEAALLAFAESVRDLWKTEFATGGGGTPMASRHTSEVKFTEVGACTQVITSATDADGSGGNLSQPHPTQWASWAAGLQPVGTASGGTTVCLPYETTLALTFQTDTRGARGRGRAYMPPFATNVMVAGGTYNDAIATGYGASFGTFLDAVNAAHSGIEAVVVSKRAVQLHPITSILVGRVPDSQRRRRRSQNELRALAWSA